MDGGALASPIGAAATAAAPTAPNGKVRVTVKPTKAKGAKRKSKVTVRLATTLMRSLRLMLSSPTAPQTTSVSGKKGRKMMSAMKSMTMMRMRMSLLLVATIATVVAGLGGTAASAGAVEFGLEPGTFAPALSGPTAGQAGAAADLSFMLKLNIEDPALPQFPAGTIRDLHLDLPKGLIANPTRFASCPVVMLALPGLGTCVPDAIVGRVQTRVGGNFSASPPGQVSVRLYRVPTQGDEAAAFAFKASNLYVVRMGAVATPERGYRIRTSVFQANEGAPLTEAIVTLYGIPAEYQGGTNAAPAPAPPSVPRHRFLSVPTRCEGDPLRFDVRMEPWSYTLYKPFETSADLPFPSGCDQLQFDPTIKVTPDHQRAGQPAGYTVELEVPQNADPVNGLETPNLRDAVVTLPKGVAISPPQANGLEACSDAQIDLHGNSTPGCPSESKIGEVLIDTPLLDDPVTGNIFIGSQESGDPMSGEMYRIFVAARAPGVRLKLKGQIRANPDKGGQLEATFSDNPELPFSKFTLTFKGGDTAPLVNPACGTHRTTSTLTPWGGPVARPTADFVIDQECATGRFAPGFHAGTTNPLAGAYAPFNLVVARQDGDKELKAIKSVRLPEGLLGRVASVPLCGEAQAAAGTCPEASRVGHVQAALGAGSSPLWVPQVGKEPTAVYLAGPWRGAPYSLSIVVPAQAGPFDLGRVVVRSALHIDERTTAISTGIDETRLIDTDGTVTEVLPDALPTILKGIVLRQREIRVIVDREDFMVNPTDCSLKQITAEVYSVDDDRVDVGNRFRAADCALLGFKPRFRARILDKGRKSTLRSFHPRTKFTVTPRRGDTNIAGARVVLPSSTLLDQANIGTTCTRAQMSERKCPEASIVGYAKAWSPLLRDVVEGPVYLAANGGARPLPDLAAVLDGEIRVVLQGEVSTLRTGGKARLQNTFRVVPDAPVERFELTMRGGKKTGLLVNSTDLCRSNERGVAVFTGQNNRRSRSALRLTPSFKGCRKVRRQAARKAAARKVAARKAARRKVTRR